MRQMVLVEAGIFELHTVEQPPAPGENEILLRVAWVGVSGTEMLAIHRRLPGCTVPQVLGMLLAGKVVQCGSGHRISSDDGDGKWPVKVGADCVVDPFVLLPMDPPMPSEEPILEIMGLQRAGGLADYVLVPSANVHATAGPYSRFHIPMDTFPLITPLALAVRACRRGGMEGGERVLVVGPGPLGMATALYAQAHGCTVQMMVPHDQSAGTVQALSEGLPGVRVIQAECEDPPGTMAKLLAHNEKLPNLIVDTTGEAETMKMGLGLLAYQGRLVYAGYFWGQVVVPCALLYGRELSVIASRHAEPRDFKEAIRVVESEGVPISSLQMLVSHRCELEEFAARSTEWAQPDAEFVLGMVRMGDV